VVYLKEIVKIGLLTVCQGLIGKCNDFELYPVVNRKLVEVSESLTC